MRKDEMRQMKRKVREIRRKMSVMLEVRERLIEA